MYNLLKEEFIRIGSNASNKKNIIKEISSIVSESPIVSEISEGEILEALFEREELCSTGLGEGIAIPHCNFMGLKDFVMGLIVLKDGIDFDAVDSKPSKLIFFIVGPSEKRNRHIKLLSSISLIAKDKNLYNQLLSVDNPSEIISLLTPSENEEPIKPVLKRCQFVIHLQQEDMLDDVLEILTSAEDGGVTVLDGSTAASYLHRLPLFSSFWNESDKGYCKIIMAVVDKRMMNDLLRRLKLLRADNEGLLVTVTDLIYSDGSLI